MRRLVIATAILAILCACSGSGHRAVPRPEGYPRIAVPDTVYADTTLGPITFSLNSAATATLTPRGRQQWINLRYPSLPEVEIYLTVSTAEGDDMRSMLENRLERIALDSRGLPTQTTDIASAGQWEARLYTTPGNIATPFHILATRGHTLLSGAAYLRYPQSTQPDSVAPVIEALRRDLTVMLHSLR